METIKQIQNSAASLLAMLPEWMTSLAFEIILIFIGLAIIGLGTLWVRRKAKKEFNAGESRGEVVVSTLIVEEKEDGRVLLKPRVNIPAQSITDAFVNEVMVREIYAAISRCDESARGSFIQLSGDAMHDAFMEKARGIASEIGSAGHVARAAGAPYNEYIFYAIVTFSMEGPHRKVRIDLLHESDIVKFLKPAFVHRITGRAEEGDHADLAAICAVAAEYWDTLPTKNADAYLRRTSISFPK